MELWFTEFYKGEGMDLQGTGLTVKVKKAITKKTSFQEVILLDTVDFGKMLVLDGAIQTTEKDEFIYHEMIVHPALFTLGRKPEKVLVIGGGDGGTVREVLKHEPKKIELVEIDKDVVNVNIEELFDELVSLCENEDKIFIYKTKEKQDIQAKTDNWEMVF